MAQRHYYTDEQKEELLSNPYTARITNCSTVFTLAFKQFVMENVDKPNMTSTKIFRLAGYRDDLFSAKVRRTVVLNIRREAATKEGLQEPKPIKKKPPKKKKYSEKEFEELEKRIILLEQQISFLKKSQFLKRQNRSKQPTSSD